MRTLILAERPLHDLRSRAILLDLAARLEASEQLLLATAAAGVPRGFAAVPPGPDPAALGVERVVLAGVFQDRPELERALALAAQAVEAGARLEARGLSLERGAARRDPPKGAAVLDRAAFLEAREAHTANALLVWRVAAPVRILAYPERLAAPDQALAAGLPDGKLLGLAMLNDAETRRALPLRLSALRPLLTPCRGWPILPLPAESGDSPADDLAGTRAFAAELLPGSEILLPALADQVWRRRQLTAGRLRALAARCALVVTNQDLTAACAIAAGVPVFGLWLGEERRIASCFAVLANELPPGSLLLRPRAG